MNVTVQIKSRRGFAREFKRFNDSKDHDISLYTGIKDKNDNQIFSNDIILFDDDRYIVKYDNDSASFMLLPIYKRSAWYDETPLLKCFRKRYKKIAL